MNLATQLLIEFFGRGIWEAVLFLYGTLFLSNIKIDKKSFSLFSVGLALFALVIRHLPISTGIHTLLILVCLNIIAVSYYKISLEMSVRSSLIVTVIVFALEGLNGGLILLLKGAEKLNTIRFDPIQKILYFIPSLVIFALITIIGTMIIRQKRAIKKENAGSAEQ